MTFKESIEVRIKYNKFITSCLKDAKFIRTKEQVINWLEGSLDGLLECLEAAKAGK